MPATSIISLAILKANWDRLKKDYLENFVPFVTECIRTSGDTKSYLSLPVLQAELKMQFGLDIPQNSIQAVLKRAHRRGYIVLDNGAYRPNLKQIESLNFYETRQKVLKTHEALIDQLIVFCTQSYSVTWGRSEAEEALQTYIQASQLFILNAATNGNISSEPRELEPTGATFIVGAFVKYIADNGMPEFDYFETIAKGHMLANAIFLPDPDNANMRFRRIAFYFDTTFLIHALGYAGSPRQEPCLELLQLLYQTGADLRCFRHTFSELRGALDAIAYRIGRLGHHEMTHGPAVETDQFFLAEGSSQSDILLLSERLEESLESLQIRVVDRPDYRQHEAVIDEKALTNHLGAKIPYRNPQALVRDVESISAIMRSRRGEAFYFIEECRALFVTNNSTLSTAIWEFFYKDTPPDTRSQVSPCVTDYTLTNLLWLKMPGKAPNLPRKRIIADCYAAMQPSEELWRAYLVEVNKLERQGKFTPDDCYLLRYSLDARNVLMESTLGDVEAFTRGTPAEILTRVQERIRQEERARTQQQLNRITEEKRQAEAMAKSLSEKETSRIARLKGRASTYARTVKFMIEGVCLVLLIFITLYTTVQEDIPIWARFASWAVLIIGVINLMYGTALISLIRRLELWLNARIYQFLESLAR